MVKCSFALFVAAFGVNILLFGWNVVERYRNFKHRRFMGKAPNNYDMLKHFIDENVLEEAANSSEQWMRLGHSLLNSTANISFNHQADNRDINNSNSSVNKDVHNDSPTKKEKRYLLAVMLLSTPNNNGKIRRQLIRDTWKKGLEVVKSIVLFKFVLGTAGVAKRELISLESEQASYNDLVLLESLKDEYRKLPLKVLSVLVWADNNIHFSYLFKCDDDTYVRLGELVSELNKIKTMEWLYWGYFLGHNKIVHGGKTSEFTWFLCERFLPFPMGAGYILSSKLVHLVARNADDLHLYNNEDSTLALWLSPYKIERKHEVRFQLHGKARGCSNKHILSGELSAAEIKSKYELLLRSGGKQHCKVERLLTYGYQYNWTVLPSQCCNIQSPENVK